MATPTRERVRKSRDALRAQGLRPVQIWVQDTRSPAFKAEMTRQMAVIAAAEANDYELWGFLDAAAADLLQSIDD